jgi:hypothetical protein
LMCASSAAPIPATAHTPAASATSTSSLPSQPLCAPKSWASLVRAGSSLSLHQQNICSQSPASSSPSPSEPVGACPAPRISNPPAVDSTKMQIQAIGTFVTHVVSFIVRF